MMPENESKVKVVVSVDRMIYELETASEEVGFLNRRVAAIPLTQSDRDYSNQGVRIINVALKNAYELIPEMAKRIQELEEQLLKSKK